MVGTNKKTGLPYKRCKTCADKSRAAWKSKITESAQARETALTRFAELWGAAQAVGEMAGSTIVPEPMYVGTPTTPLGDDLDPRKGIERVDDGVCGMAAIHVTPGNCAFANWLLKTGKALRDSYHGGVMASIHEHRQSLTRKEAHAAATVKYLNEHIEDLKGTGNTYPTIRVWSRID
jgi:hypothetical protein